ncbi:MAG: hypothetical protein ACOVOV_09625 [Dolichospermum sp.]
MALISLDQIFLPLRYVSGSGTLEFATDNAKSASFSQIIISGSTQINAQSGSVALAASQSVYIVDSGSLEGNPVDGGSF